MKGKRHGPPLSRHVEPGIEIFLPTEVVSRGVRGLTGGIYFVVREWSRRWWKDTKRLCFLVLFTPLVLTRNLTVEVFSVVEGPRSSLI